MFLSPFEMSAVADVAIATLNQIGVTACFVGGMACKLYGNDRTPGVGTIQHRTKRAPPPLCSDSLKDLDILCLGCPWGQEELKRRVVTADPSFYLFPSMTPGATYKVLWYGTSLSLRCKVDLLFPGMMNIPWVPVSAIHHPEPRMPCAPFTLVFLLKLQAWVQHTDSEESRFRLKANTDALDLKAMLPIARSKRVNVRRTEIYLPLPFVASAVLHAKRFAQEWPETLPDWRTLGFGV